MERPEKVKIQTPLYRLYRRGRIIETEGRVHLSMGLILASHYSTHEDSDSGRYHVLCNKRGYFGTRVDDEIELTCKSCIRIESNTKV